MTCVTCGATTAGSRRSFARYKTSTVAGLTERQRALASSHGLTSVCLCDHCAQKRDAERGPSR